VTDLEAEGMRALAALICFALVACIILLLKGHDDDPHP